MIRDQCRAYCQCAYCATNPKDRSGTCMNVSGARMTCANGSCKDETYQRSLQNSLRAKSFLDSSKNASRFIPDEQLLSSTKKREAKDLSLASQLVPLRRRDRLQELLLLENKARLREEARLRAERRALGLPEEEEMEVESAPCATPVAEAQTPSSTTSSQKRLSSGRVAGCSAEEDLQALLQGIKTIAADDSRGAEAPLSQRQVFELRKLVHEQNTKSRQAVEKCERQPHLCNHCYDVNVQARHLCEQPNGSVAFGQTGKVINPEEGIKYGVEGERGFDGTYNSTQKSIESTAMLSGNRARLTGFTDHPYGTGMVFLPATSAKSQSRSVRFQATFNNNIGADEAVESDLQYPGSTYNVYDDRAAVTPAAAKAKENTQPKKVSFGDTEPKEVEAAVAAAPGATATSATAFSSSASMWKTTNQDRESDMKRFLEFQKKIKGNSQRVYTESASRNAAATVA